MRRRLYLMRHGAVSYFRPDGKPVQPDDVGLNDTGRAQASATRDLLAGVHFDRVLSSGLPRTVETAEIVARSHEVEEWSDLRELRGERLSGIPAEQLEEEFVHAFRGIVPLDKRFLGGETIGELFDRVLPAVDRLFADDSWDTVLAVLHGGVNRAILSHALTGERMFLGHFEQAPGCVNVLDVGDVWPADAIVRAVNVAAHDFLHTSSRLTTMEGYWAEFQAGGVRPLGSDP
jgi:probable phosphoglycerate mutase